MRASRLNLKDPPSERFHIHSVNRAENGKAKGGRARLSAMADETNDFFPATSTVGKSFLNLKDGPKEVGIEDVSSMGGDCRNMKMVAFKGGVRERIQTQPARPASNQRHVPNATL